MPFLACKPNLQACRFTYSIQEALTPVFGCHYQFLGVRTRSPRVWVRREVGIGPYFVEFNFPGTVGASMQVCRQHREGADLCCRLPLIWTRVFFDALGYCVALIGHIEYVAISGTIKMLPVESQSLLPKWASDAKQLGALSRPHWGLPCLTASDVKEGTRSGHHFVMWLINLSSNLVSLGCIFSQCDDGSC